MPVCSVYDLCGADYYIQRHDVDLLQRLCRELPWDHPLCINIGAAYGTSAIALLSSRPDAYVVSVDAAPCPDEQENLKKAGYKDCQRYLRVLGDSHAVARAWRFGSVSLVFVDGGHYYAECYGDLALWVPLLQPGGIVAIHDYEADMLAQVKPAVDDYVAANQETLQLVDRVGKLIAYRVRYRQEGDE